LLLVILRESGGPSIPEALEIDRRRLSVLARPVKPGDDDGTAPNLPSACFAVVLSGGLIREGSWQKPQTI
jgi:hypothetical protein